jgi:glutamate/tyrosine decarboxylase-like PLP-dependent enzyme
MSPPVERNPLSTPASPPPALSDTTDAEETLDPQDWSSMLALGHRVVEDSMRYLETVRERPVWRATPDDVKAALRAPLPLEPEGAERAYEDFKRLVLPYPLGNIHPRFWGWVMGAGTPLGALSEMLAATMNSNCGGGEHVANYVEYQVIAWLKEMLHYAPDASGILVSGGSMANLIGLAAARNAKAEVDLHREGLQAVRRRMVLYGSVETHNSVKKALSLLGLGHSALREIPVDADFKIDLAALDRAIADDLAAGHQPFCIIGTAGTVNTGACDDLNALADRSRTHGLWFHVDGAFGAFAALSPRLAPKVAGMERADSLAFDLHKWMYVPFEAGCTLVRDEAAHRNAFTMAAEYLTHTDRGPASGAHWPHEYGMQLTRGFRALKVWMSLKEHGARKYGRLVEQNAAQARYLAERVEAEPDLELLAPTELNITCFRVKAPGLGTHALNALNEEVLTQVQEAGIAVPSSTTLNGRFAIRVAITNHRTRREDLDVLVNAVLTRARALRGQNP